MVRSPSLALFGALALGLVACQAPADPPAPPAPEPAPAEAPRARPDGFHGAFASQIEEAQGGPLWDAKEAVSADLVLMKGEEVRMKARMIFETTGGRARLEPEGGGAVVYDGTTAWVTPDLTLDKPRFHVLTWPYFLAAPFKLDDPGTHLTNNQERPLLGADYATAKLTFGEGVGDTPDDWYVVYREPKAQRLKALAYIVTYGKDMAKAEAAPHALVYDDFQSVEGVTFGTRWAIYDWTLEAGAVGDPLTTGAVSNLRFVTPDPKAFERPEGAIEAPMPD